MRMSPVVLACTSALAACSGGGGPAPADVDAPGAGVIELADTTAFWLPINSERLGASGRAGDVCVGLVWDFSNLGMARTRHCDDFVDHFPYAVVRASGGVACGAVWDYAPDATVSEARGCIDPDWGGNVHAVDVTARVTSPGMIDGVVHLVVER